jgi:hypothetical protein
MERWVGRGAELFCTAPTLPATQRPDHGIHEAAAADTSIP